MQVVYLNGRRLQLTWREAQGQFRHPLFVGMIMLLSLCIVAIGPYDHLLNFGPLRLAIFYAVCFVSFTVLLYLALYTCHRCKWRAFSLFTVSFSCLGATLCGLAAALVLGAPMPTLKDMGLVIGFNIVFCYLGEVIQSTFIIPRVLADLRGHPPKAVLAEFIASEAGALAGMATPALPAPTPAPDPTPAPEPPPATEGQYPHDARPVPEVIAAVLPAVTLFGQPFARASIFLIEAEEHYVAVTLQEGTRHLLRGRIADAIAAMPPELGRQVHRSYWVATTAVAGFRPEKSGAHLILTNGQTVPVARPRIPEVRVWAEAALLAQRKKAPQGVPSVSL
ncbi:MAG: LytTR family DNA-binding domain-containing protein [Paracoccaceae bacterium]